MCVCVCVCVRERAYATLGHVRGHHKCDKSLTVQYGTRSFRQYHIFVNFTLFHPHIGVKQFKLKTKFLGKFSSDK